MSEPVTLRGLTLSSPEEALALLDADLAGKGGVPGGTPHDWPGWWLHELHDVATTWRAPLTTGLVTRIAGTKDGSVGDDAWQTRHLLLAHLSDARWGTEALSLQLLQVLDDVPHDSATAHQLLKACADQTRQTPDSPNVADAIAARVDSHPALIALLARLDWERAEPMLGSALAAATPGALEHTGGALALIHGRTSAIIDVLAELDAARLAAFAPHMRSVDRIFGMRDKKLRRRLRKVWPEIGS